MFQHCKKRTTCIFVFLLIFSVSISAFAGGPFIVTEDGVPVFWGENPTVEYHPEEGSCSTFSNAEMLTKLAEVLSAWDDLTEVDLSFDQINDTLTDIDGDNYETYLYTGSGTTTNNATLLDGFNAVAFDNDGDIVAAVAGESNRYFVLGFAAVNSYSATTGQISDGMAVLNCLCIGEHPIYGTCETSGIEVVLTEEELDFTILHEFGHFLNLDHSQVNIDFFDDDDTANDADIPIMFPYSFDTSSGTALREDDIVALATLYPNDDFLDERCLITGDLLDASGNPLRCADMQASTDDPSQTVAYVSGASAAAEDNNGDSDTQDSGECNSDCGHFELYLVPGRNYTLTVKPINSAFVGGSGVGPCSSSQLTTITEEDLLTIDADQCVAGQTTDIGNIISASTGGTSSGGSSGSSGSSGDTPDSAGESSASEASSNRDDQDGKNPINYGCELNSGNANVLANDATGFVFIFLFAVFVLWRIFLFYKCRHDVIACPPNIYRHL